MFFIIVLAIFYYLFNFYILCGRGHARIFFFIYLRKRKGHRSSLFRERKEYAVYFSVAVPSALYTTQPRDEFLSVVW